MEKHIFKHRRKAAAVALGIVLVSFLVNCSKLQRFDFDEVGNAINILKTEECNCKNKLFYYYNNGKVFIDSLLVNNYLIVGFDEQVQGTEMVDYIDQIGLFYPLDTNKIFPLKDKDYSVLPIKTKEPKTCLQLQKIIYTLEQSSLVVFANLVFRAKDTCSDYDLGLCFDAFASTDEFMVRVKDTNNLSDLYDVMQETNTQIEGKTARGTYIMLVNKNSKGNALEMANYFYETGKFLYADPDFLLANFNKTIKY